jgi:hypothetical protein
VKIEFENVLIIFLFASTCSLSFLYFQCIQQLRSISKTTIDLFFKNSALEEQINSLDVIANYDTHKENFIKFLSDSRDWAFEYIDTSQKQIKDFIEVADKEFAFFDSYNASPENQLFYNNMKVISNEYKKLKSLLPEEQDDRR